MIVPDGEGDCLCVMMICRNYNDINAALIDACKTAYGVFITLILLLVTGPGLKMEYSLHLFVHASGKKSSGG